MVETSSLTGQLLIAMPGLADPNFFRSVVLLGAHSTSDGAFGLVINRPRGVALEEVLDELGTESPQRRLPEVLVGGPVEPSHGFVLFEQVDSLEPSEGDLEIDSQVRLSSDSETLSRLVSGQLNARFYLLLGYAGWHPGQLEREIEQNSWLVAPFDPSIVFDLDLDDRWSAALRSIGVEPGSLVDLGAGSDPS